LIKKASRHAHAKGTSFPLIPPSQMFIMVGISAKTSMSGRSGALMMAHLGKGFWFIRGVPGKQDPMWDKTL